WFPLTEGRTSRPAIPQKKAHIDPSYVQTWVRVRLFPATDNCLSLWRHSIIGCAMSIRLVGGASDGCRPKLHRWPFSCLYLIPLLTALSAPPSSLWSCQ